MTNVTQADRVIAEHWRFIECMHCSEYDGDFVADLAADIAAHRIAAEKETERRIVEWLRDDASLTEIEARRILGNLITLTPADTEAWAKLIAMKHGIKDAIERGDYKEQDNG